MKKLLLISACASALLADTSVDAVKAAVAKMLPSNVAVDVAKKASIADGWDSVEISFKDPSGNVVGTDLLFSNGRFVTPVLLDAKAGIDYKAEYKAEQERLTQQAIAKGIPEYVKTHSNTVKLGDKGGAITVVFSDPDCPFCRHHFANIEKELEQHDILMILTPLPMHKNALSKSVLLLDEIKKLGDKASTAQKLEVFKKYFADMQFSEPDAKAKEALSKQVEDAFKLGVNYTPAIFNDIKL